MYIGYLNDRKELGFSCIKDIDATKQLFNLKKFLKNPVELGHTYEKVNRLLS